jgi:cyclic-di-AMP phosphodiesterase PgpH
MKRLARVLSCFRSPASHRRRWQAALLLLLVVGSLTAALGQQFYNQPQLQEGRIAPQTITAPGVAVIEDPQATANKRSSARAAIAPVLMLDDSVTDANRQQLKRILAKGKALRKLQGRLPYLPDDRISLETQRYLRQTSDADWQQIWTAISKPEADSLATSQQRQAAQQLQSYRRSPLGKTLGATLNQQVLQARQIYQTAQAALSDPRQNEAGYQYGSSLLSLTDRQWDMLSASLPLLQERVLAQGVGQGLSAAVLKRALQLQVAASIDANPPELRPLALSLLQSSLKPNLQVDPEQTQHQAEQAAQAVAPELITVQPGNVLVAAGQTISPTQFLQLDHFGLSRRATNWPGLLAFGALVSGGACGFWQLTAHWQTGPRSAVHGQSHLRRRDYLLIAGLALTTPLLVALQVPATNLPMIGVLLTPFFGVRVAVLAVGALGLLLPIGLVILPIQWFPSLIGGLVAARLAGRLRSREELALLGVAVGLIQGVLYLTLGVATGGSGYDLLGMTVIHGLLGLAWCIVAIGISPYLEQVFDLVTTLRLVELANPNRPLLKRLAEQTPGTFQHTLFVANLAEAAAKAIDCNVELVRTGALYHDIGKMHDPLGFIENQMSGPNKHTAINNPWKSADIIKKHVSEGLVMAKRARLPRAVQAFIPEHQGTMLIAYFYHQAQEQIQEQIQQQIQQPVQASAQPVRALEDGDFRYAGPAPQSRETGVLMLADATEAALRSLGDATPELAHNMIQKIFRARWQEGQLNDSGLSRSDLDQIAAVFVQTWQQSNHQRIAYPKTDGPD